jgi:hypothetical protein
VRGDALAAIVHRIELSPIRLRVILSAAALSCPTPEMLDLKEAMLIRDVPLRIKRRGVEMRLVIAGPSSAAANRDPTLLKEIRRAHRCFEALVSGRVRSVAELATAEGISDRYEPALLRDGRRLWRFEADAIPEQASGSTVELVERARWYGAVLVADGSRLASR